MLSSVEHGTKFRDGFFRCNGIDENSHFCKYYSLNSLCFKCFPLVNQLYETSSFAKKIKLSKVSDKTDESFVLKSGALEEIFIIFYLEKRLSISNGKFNMRLSWCIESYFHWNLSRNRNLSEKCSTHELVIFFGPSQNITFSCVCKCWKQIMKIEVQNHMK